MNDDLPPLPDPINYQNRDGRERYTSDQMRAYARAALAAHAQPAEPVARVRRRGRRSDGEPWVEADFAQDGSADLPEGTPLYAATPFQPTLSDERVDDLAREMVRGGRSVNWLVRAVLAAAQEKQP